MTRWARAGSTQKHRKMPEDPTPWEEFAEQIKTPAKMDKKFLSNKVKKVRDEVASTSLKKKIKRKLKETKIKGLQQASSLFENNCNEVSLTSESELPVSNLDSCDDGSSFKKRQKLEQFNKKKRKNSVMPVQDDNEINVFVESKKLKCDRNKTEEDAIGTSPKRFCTHQENLNSSSKNKNCKKGKKKLQENFECEATFLDDEEHDVDSDPSTEEVQCAKSSLPTGKHSFVKKNKKTFFEKVEENRERSGIILLPREVENRLYRMKKALREKGISGDQIKKLVRVARRNAELKHRKLIQKNSKTCFNCRETGHIFADCPKIADDNEQGSGICFKCGSTEHVSFRCHIKTSDFPFAKCFICHNTGHLSRNCPKNEHGIYPKGGKCNLCGSVYHLRKDCSKSSRKKKDEDAEITVHTISELRSVDDEIVEAQSKPVKQKKPKIVKF